MKEKALSPLKPESMFCRKHSNAKFRSIRFTDPKGIMWLNNNVQICKQCVKGGEK